MSEVAPKPAPAPLVKSLLVVCGIAFAIVWTAAHVAWGATSLMGAFMANDSGAASHEEHTALIGGMLGGQILAGAAGIPGGLAFFWRDARKGLWILFAILFATGTLWQVVAFQSFLSSLHAAG